MDLNKFYNKKRVLITGGLGFIGSNLAIKLVELDAELLLVDSLFPEYGGNTFNIEPVKDALKVNIADIRDSSSVDRFVQGQDLIFNLAGTLSHIDSMRDPFTDLEINCKSQLSLIESCRRYNPGVKILFAGTRGQYGKSQYLPVDEKHPLKPTDVNGINNLAAEMYHLLYNDIYGIRATSLRLTNTYGPRHQMKHSRQGIINWFIRQIMDGEEISIYGEGEQKRDLNYVDDVVDAMLIAMADERTNGRFYNIGHRAYSLKEAVEAMIGYYGKGKYRLIPYPKDYKKIEVGDYIADYSAFSNEFGWSPQVDLREGLEKTFKYYKTYKSHYWKARADVPAI